MLIAALAFSAWLIPPVPQEDPYRIPFEDEKPAAAGFDQASLDAKMAEILPRLEKIRGWSFQDPVAAGVQSIEDFMIFAAQSMEEEYGAEGYAGKMASAVLLGLLPADQDLDLMMKEMLEASVGGYYDPKTRHFWIMEGFSQGPLADMIMAHELEHALDDQRFPLEPLLDATKGDSDRQFAVRAVVEGSATSAMNLYLVEAIRNGWLPPGDLMSADLISEQLAALADAPASMLASLLLPYVEGNVFLLRGGTVLDGALRAPLADDLQRAFTAPPTSSEQILHPEKYWDPAQLDPPRPVSLPDRSPDLGADWVCVDEDTLGELGCALLAVDRLPSPIELQFGATGLRHPASAGWGGDRFRTYQHPEGGRVLHARIEWDTEADAREFAAALERPAALARIPLLRLLRRDGAATELLCADAAGAAAAARLQKAK